MVSTIRRALTAVGYPLTRPIARFLFRVLFRSANRHRIDGFDVLLLNVDDEADTLKKLESAIGLIRQYDPKRYNSLRRGIGTLAVIGFRVKLQYLPAFRTVVLRARLTERLRPDNVASILVHESCHARLERLGIPYRAWHKARIERICHRNQVWFLEKVPGAEVLARFTREDYEAIDAQKR